MATLQNEANRRIALEGRLHAQILLQSETLIAMEVKLLKLEAKVEKREAALRRRNVNFDNRVGSIASIGGVSGGGGPAAAPAAGGHISFHTSSRSGGLENGTIDEEDVFDMREIRVNTNESHSRNLRGSMHMHNSSGNRIGSGTNIAVISSGASLASGVTATSFLDGLEAHDDNPAEDDDEESEGSGDGDVEDEGDNVEEEHDGSASSEFPHVLIDHYLLTVYRISISSPILTYLLSFTSS